MAGFPLVPFFRPWFDDVPRSHSLFDQFFGQQLFDDDLMLGPMDVFAPQRRYLRGPQGQMAPMRASFDRLRSGLSQVTNDKNEFKVSRFRELFHLLSSRKMSRPIFCFVGTVCFSSNVLRPTCGNK
jgi:hypothetical protein